MQKLSRLLTRIKVHKSFLFFIVMAIALGILEQFFILIFLVTLHEMTHVLVARIFGIKTEQIILTPLGEIAFLESMEDLSLFKRALIVLSGPFTNIVIAFITGMYGHHKIAAINIMLALFNLLPVNPLDGSRLVQILLSKNMGVLTINRLLIKVSRFFAGLLIILGIIQTVLFPYNLSLVCLGLWVYNINRKENIPMQFDFCRIITGKNKTTARTLPVKILAAWEGTKVKTLIEKLSWEYIFEVRIISDDEVIAVVDEKQIMKYVMRVGITGTLKDVI